ncbi:MAG TPA: hypothetical protein VGK73_08730 [Polyangiaceae bacterium]
MTFAPFKAGSYIEGERLLSAQVNQLNTDIPFALDGRSGGEFTPSAAIEVRGDSALKVDAPVESDDVATKEYVDDAIADVQTLVRAWVTLDNVTKSIGAPFGVALVSSYPSGAWTVIDGLGIQVPEPGMYEVALVSTMQHEVSEGAFVQAAFGYGSSMVGSFTVIGFASGYSYDATNAIPARVVGSVPHIPVTVPATTRFVLLPASAGDMTPVLETEQPGQLHQFVITKIGELP